MPFNVTLIPGYRARSRIKNVHGKPQLRRSLNKLKRVYVMWIHVKADGLLIDDLYLCLGGQISPAFAMLRNRAVPFLDRRLQKSAIVGGDLWRRVVALLKNPSSSWATIGTRPRGHIEWL